VIGARVRERCTLRHTLRARPLKIEAAAAPVSFRRDVQVEARANPELHLNR
jgi:hypothetical protein